MDYAGAVLRGKAAPSPAPAPAPAKEPVKPIARPTPAPIAPPKSATTAIVGAKVVDPVEAAGPFGKLLPDTIVKIATHAGPAGVCNLGVTCKYLKEKVLTQTVWKMVQGEVAATKKPVFRFRVEFAGSTADVDDETSDDAPEVKSEGKVISLVLAQAQRETQRQKVVSHWMDIVTQAQKARDAKHSKLVDEDPLASQRKEPINAVLGGGIVIEQAGSSRNKRIYASSSIADVQLWLDAILSLLRGTLQATFTTHDGPVTLTRVGRGGTQIIVKYGEARGFFDFADFANGLRKAVKEFVPFVGRCIVSLKQNSKGLADAEAEAYSERESVIKEILKHQNLDRNVTSMKHFLETGAIPHSGLPALFAKKRQQKQLLQHQASLEYQGMIDFVLSNLPADYEDAKLQAQRITEAASAAAEEEKKKREEERARQIEERKAREAAKAASKEKKGKEEEKAEEKKDKKMEVKKVDREGWVTREVVTVKADGSEVKPEPAPEAQQKNGKKKDAAAVVTKQNSVALQAAQRRVEKIPLEASQEYLAQNPFAAILNEDIESSQPKKPAPVPTTKSSKPQQKGQPQKGQPQKGQPQKEQPQKGQPQKGQAQKGQPQNHAAAKPAAAPEKPVSAAKPADPAPKPTAKASAQKKKQNKGQEDAKRAMSSKGGKVAVKDASDFMAPAIVGIGAVLLITVAYFFLQSA